MKLSEYANPQCEECNGEGNVEYADGENSDNLPCQVCFPPEKGALVTTHEDLYDQDRYED